MTLAPTDAITAIRDTLRPGTEREPDQYAIDGCIPSAAFEPVDRSEVAALLKVASDGALTVVPQGGRTALALGRPLDVYDIALDMRGLRRTVEYVPDDLTVTVEAGRRLGALQAELAEHGQYLTVDPPPNDDVTVGGLLATARPGAWRGHLPAARDLILGMRVALPAGEVVASGGRVVKNVTGYDLQRLHTGALGAFGVIVEATFKVAPLPAASQTLLAITPNVSAAVATAHRIWNASPALRALTVLSPRSAAEIGADAQPTILLELIGTPSTVDRSARDLRAVVPLQEATAEMWRSLRRMQGSNRDEHGDAEDNVTVVRVGVPPTAVTDLLDVIDTHGGTGWSHLATGTVIGRFADINTGIFAALRTASEERGGFLTTELAPASLRASIDIPTGDAVLVRSLRDQFDLQRTINRGRWGATL